MTPKISVIINTNGRLSYLKETLLGLEYLTYENFEVCVVYGPTEDGTREYLHSISGQVKIASCANLNLSESRNIGIALAAGDIVAFIDDDAIPEAGWLTDIAQSYEDPEVAAVGGFVYDNTGVNFQTTYVTVGRLGYGMDRSMPSPHFNFPLSIEIPHLLGTNCTFRRSALLNIGGFDEEYEYFLDETDVCCRINDAGYTIVQRSDAFVHHKFAPSHMRDGKRVVRNWYPLLKNRVYFGMRNARDHFSLIEIFNAGGRDVRGWETSILQGVKEGDYTEADLERFYQVADRALIDGLWRGENAPRHITNTVLETYQAPFMLYPLRRLPVDRMTICLVTQDYPPGQNGGIARYFQHLASAIARLGHNVHVLTRAKEFATVDFEDGVWVHRVKIRHFDLPAKSPIDPMIVPQHIWNSTETMFAEAIAINQRMPIDFIYCPLWDCEPLSFILDSRFNLCVALQTTLAIWLKSQPAVRADVGWMEEFGSPILALERYIVDHAKLLHANSQAIVRDIETDFDTVIPSEKVFCAPLGVADWSRSMRPERQRVPSETVNVLFVGRLESRKGIDVLFDAVPPLFEQFSKMVLHIVGDDRILASSGQTYKAMFFERHGENAFDGRVIFHGRVEEEELQAFYDDCDVFVAPSRYESFGLIYVEAMMYGKPVIGGDAGGGPEVISHGETGLLVAPGNAEALRSAIATLLNDASLRESMGRAGRERYLQLFTDDAMAESYLDCFKRSNNGAGGRLPANAS